MTTTYAVRDIFVEANGLRHHLIARGTPGSPVVMMIHGLAGQAHTFDAIANHLAAKYHVYCLDVRGRGESAWAANEYGVDMHVADLEAVREALGLQRMALVGTSMGGRSSPCSTPRNTRDTSNASSSTMSARRCTRRLKRILAYVGGAGDVRGHEERHPLLQRALRPHGRTPPGRPDRRLRPLQRPQERQRRLRLEDGPRRPLRRRPPGRDAPWGRTQGHHLPGPSLRGAKSDVLSADIARRMIPALPGTQLVEVPGVGDAPILGEPEAVKALDAFLAG